MRVLLLGMPDVASCFDRVMRIPNLGIASIAGNLMCESVHVLDLVLYPHRVSRTVIEHIDRLQPDIVGLSAMTFQYDTAKQIARIIKRIRPDILTVLGGYHATLASDIISSDPEANVFDFLVRGEGELPMNLLVRALERRRSLDSVPGLSYRVRGMFVHNPQGSPIDFAGLRLPSRKSRVNNGFTYFGKRFDVVETSRGCPKSCRFCCIHHMYNRSFRSFRIERVLEDIADARAHGAKGVFFVDDNINLKPERLLELCHAICEAGLDDMEYISQADVAGFVAEPKLPAAMKQAGFSGVFLGIESTHPDNWRDLGKRNNEDNVSAVVRSLSDAGITVAGGFIIGNPEDTEASIKATFKAARKLPLDHAIMWCLTPYPGTEIRESLLQEDLVENRDSFSNYNGFVCNVRTRHIKHDRLVRLIAREGAKLYFSPSFFLRSKAWPVTLQSTMAYFRTVSEYVTRAPKNRLFRSRHTM